MQRSTSISAQPFKPVRVEVRLVVETGFVTSTREPQTGDEADWHGLRGRVNVVLEPEAFGRLAGFDLSPETCHVFLCGNPAMIDEVSAELSARGFTTRDREHPDGNVHTEKYW